ncbi:hypothetical protein M8998_14315 [Sphingobacterium sp. lm-10]|uniref:hypothetical protein n=1 Tax=Sphingobacterium sp. lm-10 TaxID=2944904 RepID=UPI002021B511|nr:hypothetical protein [Sphingobacterium sp. lm-10]MCL7989119.1 hypothetical protein [Sphingobacterium sp. lm-10]
MIRLNHILLTMCAFCCMITFAIAQSDDAYEKIENQKVAYVTKHLNLTPSEAQRFFPIYNQYSRSMRSVKSAKSNMLSNQNDRRNSDLIEFDSKEVEVKKQYRAKFADVIGAARASEFFMVEQEFKDMLYRELQSRKNR